MKTNVEAMKNSCDPARAMIIEERSENAIAMADKSMKKHKSKQRRHQQAE